MKARPYQVNAADSIEAAWLTHRKVLLVMATGLGKTVTFADIIRRRRKKRAIVIAHREELIRQAAGKVSAVTGLACEIEMASEHADTHIFKKAPVVVASKDTLKGRRLQKFDPNDFDLLIIDEAHHAVAGSYTPIIDHFMKNPDLVVLGVTATADRLDRQAMGKVFDRCPFVYDIADGINDGWLVPIKQAVCRCTDLNYSRVSTVAGDLNAGELEDEMMREKPVHEVALGILQHSRWLKTLVFAVSIKHAEKLAEIMNRYRPGCARVVTGKTPKDRRRSDLTDYRNGKFQYLINVGVFTEGFDEPSIAMVAIARPTKSRALYVQMIGRGTRTLPHLVDALATAGERTAAIKGSAKPCLEVLDFAGNAGRHKLITVADVLGGNYDGAVVARAKAIAEQAGTAVDMQEALAQAQEDEEKEKARKREIDRQKREAIRANATFETNEVDPFSVFGIEPAEWMKRDTEPATDKQIELIQKFGISTAGMNKRTATKLIGEMMERRKAGLCTYGQALWLQRRGVDTTGMSFKDASAMIEKIKKGVAA